VIPYGRNALGDLALKLVASIAPETTSTYAAANAGLIAMLLQCLGQEYDRGVDARMRDIDDIKSLLAILPEAAGDVVTQLRDFNTATPASLKMSDMTALHAQGLNLLIALHEFAENAGNAELDNAIWMLLERMADRHAFDV
jgi:hypothetical protein